MLSSEMKMTIFDKPSTKTVAALIFSWSFVAGLVMFSVNFWVSEIITVIGLLLGFLTIIWSEKFKAQNPFVRHVFAITSFLLIAGFSVSFLGLSCLTGIIPSQFCGEHPRVSLLLADFFYVGAPVISIYLFVHIPRLVFQRNL